MASCLENEGELQIVHVARTPRETLKFLEGQQPDLVILELGIGGVGGLDLLRDIKIRWPAVRVLCFSTHEETFFAERALRAGAFGYLMKTEGGPQLLRAARCVLNGQIFLSERMGRRVLGRIVANGDAPQGSPINQLSNRELQIIHLIGISRDNRQIARVTGVSLKTIEAHRSKIKDKLSLRTTSDLIRFATHWVEREASFVDAKHLG